MRHKIDKDSVLNSFMGRPDIFADLFNAWVYDGEQVIEADKLEAADRLFNMTIGEGSNQVKLIRQRDVFKAYRLGGTTYVLLGIENQTAVHYAMPLRNMIYDGLAMLARMRQKAQMHLVAKDLKSPGEFLSRFAKDDRLELVITLVLYVGTEVWDGPRTLHEMIDFPDERLKQFVPNHFINLVVPASMDEKGLGKLGTELHEVFGCIRYAKDKERLEDFVLKNPRFKAMSYDAALAIQACTHADLNITFKEEKIDMCQAIIDMKKEAYDSGWTEGHDSGWTEGHDSGWTEGHKEGIENNVVTTVLRMHEEKCSHEFISKITGKSLNSIDKIIQEFHDSSH